jgi:hypothetical protein
MELHDLDPASCTMPADDSNISSSPRYDAELHKSTLRKLDLLLLPFLALLFLFNSLDKSNVGSPRPPNDCADTNACRLEMRSRHTSPQTSVWKKKT